MEIKSKLQLIAEKASKDSELKFTALMHLINKDSLARCYGRLKSNKAAGIDGVTVKQYGKQLDKNLDDLLTRMKAGKYLPQAVRRVEIPKPGRNEKRSLGIPAVEDKLVQLVMKEILEAIYEQDFLDCSYGFRPNRSCHLAIDRLDKVIMRQPINYVVDADIKGFFDNVSHYWLLRCLEERIADPKFLLLVRKFLKAGIMDGKQLLSSKAGTPQGGVISPVLANIYLHCVLDVWFERVFKRKIEGKAEMVRYCDDFVVCFEKEGEAERFMEELEGRLAKFKLEIAEDKSSIVKFGRAAWQSSRRGGSKVATFDFLGFTHYCTKSRRGKFMLGRKTQRKRLFATLKGMNVWLKGVRNRMLLKDWWRVFVCKLRGHFAYFGVSGNSRSLRSVYWRARRLLFRWVNGRSQKKSMNWQQFNEYLLLNPLPHPKIYYSLYASSGSK